MQEEKQTGTLENKTAHPLIVQYASSALPNARKKARHPVLNNTPKAEQTAKRAAPDKLEECKKLTSSVSESFKYRSRYEESPRFLDSTP